MADNTPITGCSGCATTGGRTACATHGGSFISIPISPQPMYIGQQELLDVLAIWRQAGLAMLELIDQMKAS